MHPFLSENFNKSFFIKVSSDLEKDNVIEILQSAGSTCDADGFSKINAIGLKKSGNLTFLFENLDDFKLFPDNDFIDYEDFLKIPQSDIEELLKDRITRSNLKSLIKTKLEEIRLSGIDNVDDKNLELFLDSLVACQKIQKQM